MLSIPAIVTKTPFPCLSFTTANSLRVLEKAGIEGFRFHELRHTFASRLAQAGTDPYTIQKLMGHKSFTTTQKYAHHYSESLRRGIAVLEGLRVQRPEAITILSHSG
jgi:integrase